MTEEEKKAAGGEVPQTEDQKTQNPPEGSENSQETEPTKSKADWLQELEDAGIVDDALEYDNLKVVQIQQLLEKFENKGSDEEQIIKRRQSEQKYNDLKKKIESGIKQLQDLLK